jgi:hypothetical protein
MNEIAQLHPAAQVALVIVGGLVVLVAVALLLIAILGFEINFWGRK